MRVLFLSRWFPYPPNNGSKLRIYNLLRGLAKHHEVTLLSFSDQPDVDSVVPQLGSICQHVQVVPWKEFDPGSRRARLGFFSLTPRAVLDTYSPELQQRLERILVWGDFNLVIASESPMAAYRRYFSHLPALFEEVEVGVLYEQFACAPTALQRLRYGLTWAKHRRYLASLLENFNACTVVSEQERQLLSKAVKGFRSCEIIPNCVDLGSYHQVSVSPRTNTLIFTGSLNYFPNYEAMVWFLRSVYPSIKEQVPEVCLTITGQHVGRPLPPARDITLTGYIDDVRPLIAGSWLSLVPLLTGGGTRLKILEAMALGTAVVATSKGAEGLEVENGLHLLIADTPENFAKAVVRLLREPELRRNLAAEAYQLVCDKYDWAVVMPHFLELVDRTANLRC